MTVLRPSTARCASSCCARARHRARIPGPGHRQRRPQAGAGLAHQGPAARAGIEQCVTLGLRPSASRRYPLVSSSLSAMFMRGGFRLLKVAAGALVGWQLWKTWQEAAAGSRTSVEFGVLHPPSHERHPGNRMAFFAGRWTVAAWRASRIGPCATAPPLRVPAGCRNPRCRLRAAQQAARRLSWNSHRRMPAPPWARMGIAAGAGRRAGEPSGVLVPQVAQRVKAGVASVMTRLRRIDVLVAVRDAVLQPVAGRAWLLLAQSPCGEGSGAQLGRCGAPPSPVPARRIGPPWSVLARMTALSAGAALA